MQKNVAPNFHFYAGADPGFKRGVFISVFFAKKKGTLVIHFSFFAKNYTKKKGTRGTRGIH